MTILMRENSQAVEERVVLYAERPISFADYLELSEDRNFELVEGVMIEKMAAQLEHEKLFAWLMTVFNGYVKNKNLGIVLGSRTAVEISVHGGRLPDLLFVRQERLHLVQSKAIYGAPDLVIEIVSPNDRPSDIIALETEYRRIGVPEIVFVDLPKGRILHLHHDTTSSEGTDYREAILTTGTLQLNHPAVSLEVDWLLREPRPDEFTTIQTLLAVPPQP
jgi:Uma2 family endonuclease